MSRLAAVLTTAAFPSLLLLSACVSLEKPDSVKICSSAPQGCSNNSTSNTTDSAAPADAGGAFSDAGPRDTWLAADADATVVADLGSDQPILADAKDFGAQQDADSGSPNDDVESRDLLAIGDLPVPPDLRTPDSPVADMATPDTIAWAPDLGPDLPVAVDLAMDCGPDLQNKDVGSDGTSANCITQIVADGYAAGSAQPCSKCNDNGNPLETACIRMLDCLKPPKHSTDKLDCLHAVSGSSVVAACVDELIKVACPGATF
jgi:hypothetical protein